MGIKKHTKKKKGSKRMGRILIISGLLLTAIYVAAKNAYSKLVYTSADGRISLSIDSIDRISDGMVYTITIQDAISPISITDNVYASDANETKKVGRYYLTTAHDTTDTITFVFSLDESGQSSLFTKQLYLNGTPI